MDKEQDFTQSQGYKYRWYIAVLMFPSIALLKLLVYSFGVVNNVYVMYFNIPYIAVDWFTLAQLIGIISGSATLSFFIFCDWTPFRLQLLVMTSCQVIASACLVSAYAQPITFPLIYFGQFCAGISTALCVTSVTTFAVNWCPKSEVGTALTIRPVSLSIASILGYVIPSHLFVSPNTNNVTNASLLIEIDSIWFESTQKRFLVYSVPFLVFFVVLFFAQYFLVPKKWQQSAKAFNESTNNVTTATDLSNISRKTIHDFLAAIKIIIKNRVHILITSIVAIRIGVMYTLVILLSEILRHIFAERLNATYSNQISGYLLGLYQVGFTLGSFASGLIYDKLNKPKIQAITSNVLALVSIIGLIIGYHFESLVTLICFIVLFGSMFFLPYSVYFTVIIQHNQSSDETLVVILMEMEGCVGGLLVGQTSRFILNYFGGIAVLFYIGLLWVLLIGLSLFIKPKISNENENKPLVEN